MKLQKILGPLLLKKKLDHTSINYNTPWYNFNSYLDCCYSLGIVPTIGSYLRYNNYYKTLFSEDND